MALGARDGGGRRHLRGARPSGRHPAAARPSSTAAGTRIATGPPSSTGCSTISLPGLAECACDDEVHARHARRAGSSPGLDHGIRTSALHASTRRKGSSVSRTGSSRSECSKPVSRPRVRERTARPPGPRCIRQGRDDQERAHRRQPAGLQDRIVRGAYGDRSRARYLWRVHALCPTRGELGIFNRSHYEDVVAVRSESWRPRRSGAGGTSTFAASAHARRRGHCDRQGLPAHLADEQRKRLQERIDDPE